MIRNLKVLGLGLVAVFAMSVVASSSASAAGLFTAPVGAAEKATIDGEQKGVNTFTLENGLELTCAEVTLHGKALTAGAQSTEVTLKPTYNTCHVPIVGLTKLVTVTTEGCNFVFNAATATTATVTVECEKAGESIKIHVYNSATKETETVCTYDVEPQGPLGGITLANQHVGGTAEEPPVVPDVLATVNTKVTVHSTIEKSICATPATTTFLSATYKGEVTLQATKENGTLVDASVS